LQLCFQNFWSIVGRELQGKKVRVLASQCVAVIFPSEIK
jgi:hypothetical protein